MFFSDLLVLATFVSSLSALRGQWNPLSQSSFQKSRMLQRRFSQSASSVSLFYIIFILLLRLQSCGVFLAAQSEVISSYQPIVALAGDDVILPCHLEPPISATSETVVWTKLGLDPKYIHVHQDGQPVCQSQNPSYNYRTTLFVDQLINGNVSLKLFSVKLSDAGKYFCNLQSMQKEASIQLTVLYHEVQSQLICAHQPIVALAGDDVILPCHLEPPISASSETVVWTRTDLDPKYIHVHHKGQLMCQRQNLSYNNRTALFEDQLVNGNIFLKLSRVKRSDAGKYFCILESMQTEASIQLIVGVVSMPIIEVSSNNSGSVGLRCESKGWYPEPEVFWLDGEGSLVSAGPTETVRSPDGLYNVSSRVTVEKRHSNNFTCRVQQKNINQTRETHIHVPACITVQSSSPWIWGITILGIATFLFIIFTLTKKCTKRNQGEELERIYQSIEMYMKPHNTARSTPP